MFCIKCGKTLDSSVESCPDCGTKVVLPEGYEPTVVEKTVKMDMEMLVGEKTVSADHSAIARKAAAAANANTAAETPQAAPVAPAAPVSQDTVPHSPAGFELKSVNKVMNGRSILIDDSPLPGTVPAYLAPVAPHAPQVQAAAPSMAYDYMDAQTSAAAPMAAPVAAKKQPDKKIIIIIAAAAVLCVAVVAVLLIFAFGKKDDDAGRKGKNNITAAATEQRTEETTFDKGAYEQQEKETKPREPVTEAFVENVQPTQVVTEENGEEESEILTLPDASLLNPTEEDTTKGFFGLNPFGNKDETTTEAEIITEEVYEKNDSQHTENGDNTPDSDDDRKHQNDDEGDKPYMDTGSY